MLKFLVRTRRLVFTLALASLAAVTGALLLRERGVTTEPRQRLAGAPKLSRMEQTGSRLYASICAYCHGAEGDGFGLNSSNLQVPPRDHTDAAYLNPISDEHLFAVIKSGGTVRERSNLMPAWGGRLTDREIAALVAYLRTLSRPR